MTASQSLDSGVDLSNDSPRASRVISRLDDQELYNTTYPGNFLELVLHLMNRCQPLFAMTAKFSTNSRVYQAMLLSCPSRVISRVTRRPRALQ